MACGARRRRRSSAVGPSSPTSTPRCPSRHRTAPGKRLHRARCGPQRRRGPADRDLRGAGRRGDQRQARVAQGAPGCASPALQGRPPGRGLDGNRSGADPPPDVRHRLPGDRPQRERQGDRGVAIVAPRCNAARHDGQDRVAVHASVAPARDHDPAGRTVRVRWSAQLTVPLAMAVKPETAAGRPSGSAAVDAGPRPRVLRRRRCGKPPLDVERVMDDSWRASGRLQQGPIGSTTSAVLVTPSTSPMRRAPCSAPKGRRPLLPQPAGPMRIALDEGLQLPSHHPGRLETLPSPSAGVPDNSMEPTLRAGCSRLTGGGHGEGGPAVRARVERARRIVQDVAVFDEVLRSPAACVLRHLRYTDALAQPVFEPGHRRGEVGKVSHARRRSRHLPLPPSARSSRDKVCRCEC